MTDLPYERRSPPPESTFKVGSVYYQCGIKEVPFGRLEPVVSSWVYLGFVHRPGCTSKSCDVPYHFYEFISFEQLNPEEPMDFSNALKLYLCTWRGESMLIWDDLLIYLESIDEDRIAEGGAP